MPSLWSPEHWSDRLAELEARSGELKEAPLRRDIRSLGALLGRVLRSLAAKPTRTAKAVTRAHTSPMPRR
jgi:phosphoenolpyruvate carboxylase